MASITMYWYFENNSRFRGMSPSEVLLTVVLCVQAAGVCVLWEVGASKQLSGVQMQCRKKLLKPVFGGKKLWVVHYHLDSWSVYQLAQLSKTTEDNGSNSVHKLYSPRSLQRNKSCRTYIYIINANFYANVYLSCQKISISTLFVVKFIPSPFHFSIIVFTQIQEDFEFKVTPTLSN